MTYFDVLPAPFGHVTPLVDERGAVIELWTSNASERVAAKGATRDCVRTSHVSSQLALYFDRKIDRFDVPLAPKGTPFQQAVWELLIAIPYGQTTTYGQLAAKMGNPGAMRAVGRANATNPVSIIVPCHRVIGASGALTGYAGGTDVKRILLDLESGGLGGLFD